MPVILTYGTPALFRSQTCFAFNFDWAGPKAEGVARNAFAVFMQPDVTAPMVAPTGTLAGFVCILGVKTC
jgi:hypothetical protein